ncbi:MAG: hypothetical protein KBF66_10225 [Rhodoferax sp.]|uniref:hypothetical protein n=1 Tax=Rhodoferax sp. TaxID=50421 RepID=UPI001B44C3E8|nr:hypothetical protein [Rhodoferax sp.]MBP9905925.1 hypothetical protein [Rhodoferax sp.]
MSNVLPVDKASSLIEAASQSADHAITASQQAANQALENLAQAMQELRHQATPVMDRASQQVSDLAHRGLNSVRETTYQLRQKAEHASENTVNYIKHEPVKSVLIAAATGAALMALISLVSHSRSHD